MIKIVQLAYIAACLKGGRLVDFKKAIIFIFVVFFSFNNITPSLSLNQNLAPVSSVQKKKRSKIWKLRPVNFESPYDGAKIHYDVLGNPEAERSIVLIHGYTGNPTQWLWFLRNNRELLQNFRIILPSLRGHGRRKPNATQRKHKRRSETGNIRYGEYFKASIEDLNAIFKREDLQSAVFFGHSMGGEMARLFYSLYPDKVDALVLVSSYVEPPFSRSKRGRLMALPLRGMLRVLVRSRSVTGFLDWYTNLLAARTPLTIKKSYRILANRILFNNIDQATFNTFFSLALATDFRAMILAFLEMGSYPINGIDNPPIPTLIIQGEGDRLISPEELNKLLSLFPHAEAEKRPGRHFPELYRISARLRHLLSERALESSL